MLFSTSAYFFSTALRRTFWLGVTSPSSTVNSAGKISNRLIVSQRSSLLVGLVDVALDQVMHLARAGQSAELTGLALAVAQPSMASGSRVISAVAYLRPSPCTTTWLMYGQAP